MKLKKYKIPQISAWDLLPYAKSAGNEIYSFDLKLEETMRVLKAGGNSYQDSTPIFFQAMQLLTNGEYSEDFKEPVCEELHDALIYLDFSGIFDRAAHTPRMIELQKKVESMFRPEGIILQIEKRYKYLAFERSASMSRESKICFVREDLYEPLRKRITLDMQIGLCQLSKLYAYNGLMFTTGKRIDDISLWDARRIVVIDNPESVVYEADVITVEDDGSGGSVRKYSRVKKQSDIKVIEFDGEGLISRELASKTDKSFCGEHIHSSFQIRMPYIKGMLHEVDFKSMLRELGVPYIIDLWGEKHPVSEVDIILTKSMFKAYGWMTENQISWSEYLERCRKYRHALYISGVNQVKTSSHTELNYQFINTLSLRTEDFRPLYLPWGWEASPENESRHWITKATEIAYYNYVANPKARLEHFTSVLDDADEDKNGHRAKLARLLKKNPKFINEPIFANELQELGDKVLEQYSVGRLIVSGDNRYLSGDLIRFVQKMVSTVADADNSYLGAVARLERECDNNTVFYAPQAAYPKAYMYTLLRNPHIARNEEAIVRPMESLGYFRKKYLSHLSYVVMVDSRTLIPERLGGADFDGDMIKTVADPLLNECVSRNYAKGEFDPFHYRNNIPLLKIPSAGAQIKDAGDWHARFETVRSTFSSRVGQICNAALDRSIIAYDENIPPEEREQHREDTETLAILTGLEIDSAKSGVKPDLSEYIGHKARNRNLLLKYKGLVNDDAPHLWYEKTKKQKLSEFYKQTEWRNVSSNVEKLPYLAYMLKKNTPKISVVPASDGELFAFAQKRNWQDKLNPEVMDRAKELIADYKEMIRRVSVSRLESESFRRRGDIERILFARGQEKDYSADALYHIFIEYGAERIEQMREAIREEQWHFMSRDQREYFLLVWMMPTEFMEYGELLMDFRHGGCRLLGDIISDIDDMNKATEKRGKRLVSNKESQAKQLMLTQYTLEGYGGDYKAALQKGCRAYIKYYGLKFDDVLKCAVALGERTFALEVLLDEVIKNAAKGEK